MHVDVPITEVTLFAAQDHPNRMTFRGIVTRLDEPSTRPPNGSQGKKIIVPSSVAAERLHTLVGMGLNYAPSLDAHAQRRKVGVITRAWIDDKDLWCEGTIWKSDFPESVEDLKGRSDLGMSMELGNVKCHNQSAPIWELNDFCFTGATILLKSAAAYQNTLAIAASALLKKSKKQRIEEILNMSVTTKTKSATPNADAFATIVAGALAKVMEPVTVAINAQSAKLDALNTNIAASGDGEDDEDSITLADIVAAVQKGKKVDASDDDEDDDDEMSAAAKKKAAMADDDEDDDDVDAAVSTGDMDDLDDDDDDATDESAKPGQTPKAMNKNHGNKTTVTKGKVKHKKMAVTGSMAKVVRLLIAQNNELAKSNKKLSASMKELTTKLDAQGTTVTKLSAASEKLSAQTQRRSADLPAEIKGLLAKAGQDPNEERVYKVNEVDAMLTASGITDSNQRISMKTTMARAGRMEEGIVNRTAIR